MASRMARDKLVYRSDRIRILCGRECPLVLGPLLRLGLPSAAPFLNALLGLGFFFFPALVLLHEPSFFERSLPALFGQCAAPPPRAAFGAPPPQPAVWLRPPAGGSPPPRVGGLEAPPPAG